MSLDVFERVVSKPKGWKISRSVVDRGLFTEPLKRTVWVNQASATCSFEVLIDIDIYSSIQKACRSAHGIGSVNMVAQLIKATKATRLW